jgi:hypothetical protein
MRHSRCDRQIGREPGWWVVAERRYFSAASMQLRTTPLLLTITQEILAASDKTGTGREEPRPFSRSRALAADATR